MTRLARIMERPAAEGLIALLVSLFTIFLFGGHLVNAPPVDPDHPFDTQATLERLSRILGDEAPHPVDSDASDAVIQRLMTEIRALGFDPMIDDAFHCSDRWRVHCARVRNIGFWVTEPGRDAVMLASHHDSVPTGPGAADDGAGVAASLEIARLMRGRDLPRPLYVLITDAEEIGLVGASRFVHHHPAARLVTAVVSLEARGNQGVTSMFETSVPNGRDLAALHTHRPYPVRGPVASSLSVDIYRAMPNGTDVTEYLTLGMDAANYAMVGRPSHYHTQYDDLAHLSENAVFHIGASALSAVEGFMTVDETAPDRNWVYADILGFGVIALPAWLAQPLVGLAALLCAAAL
ncbi:MAG: M20/M25/M40 family metallo-hydrolase, partial [Pseudomonadota bacterium]